MRKNFIQYEGDNQPEVEAFVGCHLDEDNCPDILLIPTSIGLKKCDLGMFIIKKQDGTFDVVSNPTEFKEKYN